MKAIRQMRPMPRSSKSRANQRPRWSSTFIRAVKNLFIASLAENFYQGSFAAAAVKLAVEDLLPRAEVEPAGGDRNDNFPAHDLPLQMRVGVIFAGPVVFIFRDWFVGRQSFQPLRVIIVQPALVVVDEDGSRNMHRVHEAKAFRNAAFAQAVFDLARDVDKREPGRHFEP